MYSVICGQTVSNQSICVRDVGFDLVTDHTHQCKGIRFDLTIHIYLNAYSLIS